MERKLSDCLGYLMVDPGHNSEGRPVTKISLVEKLAPEQAEEILAAIRDLYFFSSGEDLYHCFQKNMEEFLKSVLDFAKNYFESGGMTDENMNSASFEFSRLILNLLGMFKSFLDHGEAALSRKYGPSSPEATVWKQAQSFEYDHSAAYRLFSNLRNYAQHVGMPPLHFSLDHKAGSEDIAIRLEFKRSQLLETYSKWSKDARADLVNGEEVIQLFPLLDEWSHCFHRLVKNIQCVRRKEVINSAALISDLRAMYSIPEAGIIILMPEPDVSDGRRLNLGFQKVPEQQAKEILDGSFLKRFEQY